eukprot:5033518-Prymnesium_polylepis.1
MGSERRGVSRSARPLPPAAAAAHRHGMRTKDLTARAHGRRSMLARAPSACSEIKMKASEKAAVVAHAGCAAA